MSFASATIALMMEISSAFNVICERRKLAAMVQQLLRWSRSWIRFGVWWKDCPPRAANYRKQCRAWSRLCPKLYLRVQEVSGLRIVISSTNNLEFISCCIVSSLTVEKSCRKLSLTVIYKRLVDLWILELLREWIIAASSTAVCRSRHPEITTDIYLHL